MLNNKIKRVIFAGTPDFAKQSLQEIHNQGFEIVGVFTQPDRRSGRGKKISKSAVKKFAEDNNLSIFQPEKIKECSQLIKDLNADIMIVVAFGQILPQEILDIPYFGCLNIHASLLPRWRGAAPIQRAILAEDSKTGICIIQMDAGLDTGVILLEEICVITDDDNATILHDKLANLGKKSIIKALKNINNLQKMEQKGNPTYAKKLTKAEAQIDWSKSAKKINQQIRAFNSYPIAQTIISSNKFTNKILRILQAEVVENISKTKIYQDKKLLIINCGNQSLSLKTVQLAGKNIVDIKDFNNAYKINFS